MAEQPNLPQSGESQASCRTGCPGATTPERYSLLPPSPPATDERRQQTSDASNEGLKTIGMLTNAANRENLDTFARVPLNKHQYRQHERELERLFRRHDYDPDYGVLVIRMPSTVHEYFLNRFVDLLKDQLGEIAPSASEAGRFASQVESIGSARIFLREETRETPLRRQPDAQFQHANAVYPGVVVEVSYSQDGKCLGKLAQDYILGSNGDIKAVICIDINPHGKESTISIWRPKLTASEDEYILETTQDGPCMPFRTRNGLSTNQGEHMTLYLSDFATDEISCGLPPIPLTVKVDNLYRFVVQAELRQRTRESETGVKSHRVTLKRRHSSSSAEELISGDEATFINAEDAVVSKADLEDADYKIRQFKRRA